MVLTAWFKYFQNPQNQTVNCVDYMSSNPLSAHLVQRGHGGRGHHQGDANDGVAVEPVGVRHHHNASDGQDGCHNLHRGTGSVLGWQEKEIGAPTTPDGFIPLNATSFPLELIAARLLKCCSTCSRLTEVPETKRL